MKTYELEVEYRRPDGHPRSRSINHCVVRALTGPTAVWLGRSQIEEIIEGGEVFKVTPRQLEEEAATAEA